MQDDEFVTRSRAHHCRAALVIRVGSGYLGCRRRDVVLAGILSGLLTYRFKFARFADKNIKRISHLERRASPLAFQSGKTYLLIVFMMTLGIALRHSALPRSALAVLYTGIGLLLASLRYISPAMAESSSPRAQPESAP